MTSSKKRRPPAKRSVVCLLGLLAVLLIASLFLRIGMPGLNRAQAPFAASAQLQGISHALELYYDDFGAHPDSELGLKPLRMPVGRGPYITEDLAVDPWGRDYLYFFDDSSHPIVRNLGKDGLPGGAGVDMDLEIYPSHDNPNLPSG